MTNTLAYDTEFLLTTVKSFTVLVNTLAEIAKIVNALAYSTDTLITSVKSFTCVFNTAAEMAKIVKHTSLQC